MKNASAKLIDGKAFLEELRRRESRLRTVVPQRRGTQQISSGVVSDVLCGRFIPGVNAGRGEDAPPARVNLKNAAHRLRAFGYKASVTKIQALADERAD